MPTRWSQSRSWSAYSAMAWGLPSVLRLSKKFVKRTPRTRPSRTRLRLRLRPPWTFLCGFVRWMLAAPKTTAPPRNLPRITPGTEALFRSTPKRHKPSLLIAPSELRPRRDRAGIIRRVGTIEIVAIADPAASSLKAPSRLLGSTQPRPRLKIIVAATS